MRDSVERAVTWLDRYLNLSDFDDVSNNSLQIAREGDALSLVAFGVDASVAFIREAAAAGAQLCVVHHGISWGGGIKRITGSEFRVVKAAMENNIALYAAHLPLDAHREVGNNAILARQLGLANLRRAFSYHGNVIGVTGAASETGKKKIGDAEVSLGDEQLAQLAVLVVLAADERNEASALALAEEVVEKFVGLLPTPVLDTSMLRYVDKVEVHGLAQIEGSKRLLRDFTSTRFVRDSETVAVEIPGEVLRLVDVEAQDICCVQFLHDNIGCCILTTCGNEDHGGSSL